MWPRRFGESQRPAPKPPAGPEGIPGASGEDAGARLGAQEARPQAEGEGPRSV